LYTIALSLFIIYYVGRYLVDSFYLLGLLLTAGIALLFARRPLRQLLSVVNSMVIKIPTAFDKTASGERTTPAAKSEKKAGNSEKKRPRLLRRLVPLTLLLLLIAVLLMPWEASVGNYGTLIAIPYQEAIIRAPESATLLELRARPGENVTSGAVIGRLGNLELEEQIVEVEAELARVNADYDRVLGELRARSEAAARAEAQLRQRQYDYNEIEAEQQQIRARQRAEAELNSSGSLIASTSPTTLSSSRQADGAVAPYPAAIAALQADVELREAQLKEAQTQLERARRLSAQGLMPRSELDTAETRASTLAFELAAARQRLEAALIEHRRKHASTATEVKVARSDLGAERLQIERLSSELRAMRSLINTLEERRDLLQRKQAQFELVTPRAGTVFGEDLPRMIGHYFQKGAEICRVADTRQLLLRIRVPEREIGDVRLGYPVRLKARSFPDQVFRGVVSKIGSESELDEHNQATYRVELTIDNSEGLLRPGMTAFARIDFGRQMVWRILLHKIKQALRPELWML
jgi:multidrug efflux pump subunit AcrA (membrane-fusion protein)